MCLTGAQGEMSDPLERLKWWELQTVCVCACVCCSIGRQGRVVLST